VNHETRTLARREIGLIDADGKRDLSRKVKDIDAAALAPAKLKAAKLDPSRLVKGKPRLGSAWSVEFVAIGLNFTDHAKETGSPIHEHPVVFYRAASSANDNVMVPDSTQLDWEVELVIARKHGAQRRRKDAMRYVAGYCIGNERARIPVEEGASHGAGKGCGTFGPLDHGS
jgi:2-keto-4-pentenoate hydratase/2-oxohepta-3-ene-1,7-dioic acid hydratase in catechol pathway